MYTKEPKGCQEHSHVVGGRKGGVISELGEEEGESQGKDLAEGWVVQACGPSCSGGSQV